MSNVHCPSFIFFPLIFCFNELSKGFCAITPSKSASKRSKAISLNYLIMYWLAAKRIRAANFHSKICALYSKSINNNSIIHDWFKPFFGPFIVFVMMFMIIIFLLLLTSSDSVSDSPAERSKWKRQTNFMINQKWNMNINNREN